MGRVVASVMSFGDIPDGRAVDGVVEVEVTSSAGLTASFSDMLAKWIQKAGSAEEDKLRKPGVLMLCHSPTTLAPLLL